MLSEKGDSLTPEASSPKISHSRGPQGKKKRDGGARQRAKGVSVASGRASNSMSFEEDQAFENLEASPSLIEKQVSTHKSKTKDLKIQVQNAELRLYLDRELSEPFNHYCISCKKGKSSHIVLWIGAFVCKKCAANLLSACGGMRNCYIKDIFGELWDDY